MLSFVSAVIPLEDAVALLKAAAVVKNYSNKGKQVVKQNIALIDTIVSDPNCLILVDVPSHWRQITVKEWSYNQRDFTPMDDEKVRKFANMNDIGDPVTVLVNDDF